MHGRGRAAARTSPWDKARGLPIRLGRGGLWGGEGKVAGSLAVGLMAWQTAEMITRHVGGGSSSAFAARPTAMASSHHGRVLTEGGQLKINKV